MVTGFVTSELNGAPLIMPSDTPGPIQKLYPQMLLGGQDTVDFEWTQASSADILPDSQHSLQGFIFLALLVGSVLRFLMSDTVRRFFADTLDPMNWNSYQ
jgi:hypothetical protein